MSVKKPRVLAEESEFFDGSCAPPDLEECQTRLDAFLAKANRPVVLLTSGGTTVPLERKTVRFLDNFSTGARGAAMAEQLLEHDCALVFLHREGSRVPFSSHFPSSVVDFEFMKKVQESDGRLPELAGRDCIRAMKCITSGKLLVLSFVSLTEYLYKLRMCSTSFGKLVGVRACVILAAAVSDFYLPEADMVEHKIQSSGGAGLSLSLKPVPKLLTCLKASWCPNAYCISFKLETDESILVLKANRAIEVYGVDLVVANILESRYKRLLLVEPKGNVTPILKSQDDPIEVPLVKAILERCQA